MAKLIRTKPGGFRSIGSISTQGLVSVQSAMLLSVVALVTAGGVSMLEAGFDETLVGKSSSGSAASTPFETPGVGARAEAGLASALADAARVARELAEVAEALDTTWRKLADVRRETPYEFPLKESGEPGMAKLGDEFTAQNDGTYAYAEVMLDPEASFEARLDAQRAYWELTEPVGAEHENLLRQMKGWTHDLTQIKYRFADALEKDEALRAKLLAVGFDVDAQLAETARYDKFLEVRNSNVSHEGTWARIDAHPDLSSEFDEYRRVIAASDHKLGEDVLDEGLVKAGLARAKKRTMSKKVAAQVKRDEAELRTLVERYDALLELQRHSGALDPFADVVRGYDAATQDAIYRKVMLPRFEKEFAEALGVASEQAFIFHGPPGTGKTFLAKRLAELLTTDENVRFIQGAEMNGQYVGTAEEKMRELFDEAIANGTADEPYVIIFDELDGVIPNDPNSGGSQSRRSAFLSGFDRALKENPHILVFGATNNLETLDIALRRPGRFGDEIFIGAASRQGRFDVLSKLFDELAHELDIDELADYLDGLTFADIEAVLASAKQTALESSSEARSLRPVAMADVVQARKGYVPTMLRQNDFQVKPVGWDQIAGVDHVIEQLREDVVLPLTRPELFESLGGKARAKSVLLYGPPGTGKTLITAALAGEADINVITALASNLRQPGAVAELFGRARNAKPAIILIDELEAVAKKRGYGGIDAVVNQLLTEMDGLGDGADNIIVVGTTNFKDSIDEAILRPGRLERHYYVGLPDEAGRRAVLDVHTKGLSFAKGKTTAPDFDDIARRTDGYTPADLKALTERALLEAAKRESKSINRGDFARALERIGPSLSPDELAQYGGVASPKRKNPIGFTSSSH